MLRYCLRFDFSHQLLYKIRHLITRMCGQFGVRVPEVVAELLSLASSAQVEESPSEDEGQENDYDLSDQVGYVASVYNSGNQSRLFFSSPLMLHRMTMMMIIMMNQDCLRKIVTGLLLVLLLILLRMKMNLYSGNDDDHDQDKMDEKGKAVLDKIRMTTHEDYLKVRSDCMCCVMMLYTGECHWQH